MTSKKTERSIEFTLKPCGPPMDCYKPIQIVFPEDAKAEEIEEMREALRVMQQHFTVSSPDHSDSTPELQVFTAQDIDEAGPMDSSSRRGKSKTKAPSQLSQSGGLVDIDELLGPDDFNSPTPYRGAPYSDEVRIVGGGGDDDDDDDDDDDCYTASIGETPSQVAYGEELKECVSAGPWSGPIQMNCGPGGSGENIDDGYSDEITDAGATKHPDPLMSPSASLDFSYSTESGKAPSFGSQSDPEARSSPGLNHDVVNSLVSELQESITNLMKGGASRDRSARYQKLANACSDFKSLGVSYCTTAIREIGIPDEDKTLKVDPHLGGRNGAKMVCISCIRLKNPDNKADDKAREWYDHRVYKQQKSAKHEFHYSDMLFESFFNSDVSSGSDFIMPAPCVLVSHLGHTFLVSLNLPLISPAILGRSGGSLCSSEESKERRNPADVERSKERAVKFFNELLKHAGLAPNRGSGCVLPFDGEVFESELDGHPFFIVDTARMMPPGYDFNAASKRKRDQASSIEEERLSPYLYRHMRREFVKWYYVNVLKEQGGLACDAFSKYHHEEDDAMVVKAYTYYLEHIPQVVAEHLSKLECSVFSDDLVRIVHYFGLNLRDIGRVYSILDCMEKKRVCHDGMKWENCAEWKHRILAEIVARSFRRIVDRMMYKFSFRSQNSIKNSDIAKRISWLYNSILWNRDKNFDKVWRIINIWKNECFPTLKDSDGKPVELNIKHILCDGKGYILQAFLWVSSDLLGVKWTNAVWRNRQNPAFFRRLDKPPFSVQLIREIQPRVLELNMAHHAYGMSLTGLRTEDKDASLQTIISCFQSALDRQPTNVHTMDRLARSYGELANLLEKTKSGEAAADKDIEEQIRMLHMKREYLIKMASKVPYASDIPAASDISAASLDAIFAYGLLLMLKGCKYFKDGCKPTPAELACLHKAESLLEEAAAKGHKHSKVMLADLRFFCFGNVIEKVFEPLIDVDEGKGSNSGFHKFVYLLKQRRWKEAAMVAHRIRTSNEIDPKHDQQILESLKRFQQWLELCLQP